MSSSSIFYRVGEILVITDSSFPCSRPTFAALCLRLVRYLSVMLPLLQPMLPGPFGVYHSFHPTVISSFGLQNGRIFYFLYCQTLSDDTLGFW